MRRAWIGSMAGALVSAGLFAGFVALRSSSGLGEVVDRWDEVAAAAIAGGVVTLGGFVAAFLRYRRALRRLSQRIAQFRQKPGQFPIGDSGGIGDELGSLLAPVEALCAAYRQALADRVAQDEMLESLRLQRGQLDGDKGQRLTVRGSGSSRNMVARLTPNLFWLTATPALQQFLRCKAQDLNGRPFGELVHPTDLSVVERSFQEALETGEAHNITFRILRQHHRNAAARPGRECHVNMDVLTRYDDHGKALQFRCFLVDTSDRVRAEQELRGRTEELSQTNERLRKINLDLERLKESYRDLYHQAPAMYFSLDAAGRFVTFNETLLRGLGYQREDLWKQPYTRLLTADSLCAWEKAQGPMAPPRNGASAKVPSSHALTLEAEVETQWVKKDGTIIDVWIRSAPVQDEEGRFVRSRSAAQDVTERNRLANELRARGDELERANGDLRLINRELEEFTSVVSHDLKEPLRTLQAFSNFLAEDYSGQLGPDGFQYINHLVLASRRLGTLIDDLLRLSWAGRITHDLQTFNFIEIVATVRRDLANLLLRREAELVVEGALPTVIGDPQRITQLLANLVGNGLKYNTSAKPVVTIGQVCEENGAQKNGAKSQVGSRRVTFFVRDNGIGIESRFHEQIFGIFRRLHQPEEYEGTGAGLAICKKIVEGHAGRIWVESASGQGSTFFFTLPRAPVESPERPKTQTGLESEQEGVLSSVATVLDPPPDADQGLKTPPGRIGAPRLLLVEDMPEIGLIAQKLGKRGGHELTWLKTAEEAWDYLQNERPDLLLLDVHLPGMSGLDLCRRLRELEHLSGLPIALFTQGVEDVDWGRDVGADFVLSKDLLCQPDSWLRRLEDILQRCAKAPS